MTLAILPTCNTERGFWGTISDVEHTPTLETAEA